CLACTSAHSARGEPICYLLAMVDDQTTMAFPSQGLISLSLCAPYELICCTAAGPGGHALRVLLDTGTDPSAVDAGLARRLALRTGGSGPRQGAASHGGPVTQAGLAWPRPGRPPVLAL